MQMRKASKQKDPIFTPKLHTYLHKKELGTTIRTYVRTYKVWKMQSELSYTVFRIFTLLPEMFETILGMVLRNEYIDAPPTFRGRLL